jgi:restriction endonuclease S subunit
MLQRSSGGNYPAITSEELKKVIVLLPPPKTQNSIVQLMDNAYEIKKQKETEAQQLIDSINDYVLSELGIKLPELKDKICFVVWSDEIEERIDPFYYRYDFVKIDKNIKSLNHKRIRDLSLDLKNGSTPAGGVFEKEGVPYFRSQDFNLFDFKINQFITPDFHKQLMRSAIRSGDVLVAVVGATLGVIGYVPKEIKEGNINQNVARVRVIDKNINPKYLAILLASDLGQKQIFRNATVTTQAYLNNQQLGEIKIPLPPLQIQNNIANEVKARMQKAEQLQKEAKTVLEEAKERVERVILGEEEI